jgi:hypothetical protein
MKRWNERTQSWETFSAGVRRYPRISPELAAQLEPVVPTTDGLMTYRPCKVTLDNGSDQDFVYVVNAASYIKAWGIWPDQDLGKREIRIEHVRNISESPSRLPPHLSQKLYDAGESGMGYVVFELSFIDGSRSCHLSGNATDFVVLPKSKSMQDIIAVHPHEGRGRSDHLHAPDYWWCLYE